ncbi:IS630 family transposase [Sedimentitalea sp.]|uniref:IS630 family transposase n=1 Tax=Sedimentitalea sp. TaxID=2048915 RepID=UPI00329A7BD9
MSSALSSELRARFREYLEEGLSGRAAAARLKLSAATGVRWQRKWRETGTNAQDVQGRPPGHGKLAAHQGLLEELVAQDGDITLPELAGALASATGVVAHSASIGRFLRKLGYTYKKSLVATERLRARVKHLRQDWFKHRIPKMQAHPDRLVFIDETAVKTNLTRLRGRNLRGKRLERTTPFGAWGTQTFIAGLTHDSLIAPWVIKGAMDGEAFAAYIRQVLAPELLPGTVVICDNLATHRNKDAAQALNDAGCWFLYLPPYSPDLNPIEMAFSKLKAHLRRIGARTFDQMFDALAEVCDLFTPQECWNYFCEAGYGSG